MMSMLPLSGTEDPVLNNVIFVSVGAVRGTLSHAVASSARASSATTGPSLPAARNRCKRRDIIALVRIIGLMRNTQQIRGDAGYAMAALLVAMALMALFMSIAMPVWKQASQREREEELVWRGQQYDRALQLFRRKTSAPGAPNLDMLVEQRFLRRKYKDPITGKDFALKPVALAGVNMPPGVPQPPGT